MKHSWSGCIYTEGFYVGVEKMKTWVCAWYSFALVPMLAKHDYFKFCHSDHLLEPSWMDSQSFDILMKGWLTWNYLDKRKIGIKSPK